MLDNIMSRLRESCSDVRFLLVEERLFRVLGGFLKRGRVAGLGVPDVATKAKVWDSTFYDHFKNMDDAIYRYDHRHDEAIKKLRMEIEDERLSMELAFCRILHFISKNKDYYSTHLARQNPVPFFSIAKTFRPVFACGWSNFGREKYDLCFKIFCGEMYGVIYFWGDSEKFDRDKITKHATYLCHLTKNATRRLF